MARTGRKGIILAGGAGMRLYPLTRAISKQLMPVFDKPMVYYPLSTLMLAGIREILLITTADDRPLFERLLGDGSDLGISLSYATQDKPEGIAQALVVAEEFLAGGNCALVLGDNLFHGHGLPGLLARAGQQECGATLFAYPVSEPGQYGVIEFAEDGRVLSIEEKPVRPRSQFAVSGLYFYDETAPQKARELSRSARGEYEITDLNRAYLDQGKLAVEVLGRGFAWLDTGTHASLLDAASYVRITEERQGLKICCPEEIAWRQGFIDDAQLRDLAEPLRQSGYGEYLLRLLEPGYRL